MRIPVLALAALAMLPLQVGCDLEDIVDASSNRYKEDFQYNFNLKPGGRLVVETMNGSIEVLGWEKDAVQITGTKYAGREELLKEIKIDAKADDSGVTVRATRPSGFRHGNMGARFSIRVPRQVQLERLNSSNGQIRVEDVQGNARLETSNGALIIRKVEGRLDAHTSNGRVEADTITGDVNLRTSNGSIHVDRISGAIEAITSNGSIHAQIEKPKAGVPLSFESSNGSIELEVSALEDNELRASTSNSSITVRLPASIKAQLRASTSNSSITSDFDVLTRGTLSKNHLEGSINGGGPLIHLSTSNASIHLQKL